MWWIPYPVSQAHNFVFVLMDSIRLYAMLKCRQLIKCFDIAFLHDLFNVSRIAPVYLFIVVRVGFSATRGKTDIPRNIRLLAPNVMRSKQRLLPLLSIFNWTCERNRIRNFRVFCGCWNLLYRFWYVETCGSGHKGRTHLWRCSHVQLRFISFRSRARIIVDMCYK